MTQNWLGGISTSCFCHTVHCLKMFFLASYQRSKYLVMVDYQKFFCCQIKIQSTFYD